MSLMQEILATQRAKKQPGCPVARAIRSLEGEDAEALTAALAEPDIMHVTITEVLRNRGFVMGEKAVRGHRSNACSCYREKIANE